MLNDAQQETRVESGEMTVGPTVQGLLLPQGPAGGRDSNGVADASSLAHKAEGESELGEVLAEALSDGPLSEICKKSMDLCRAVFTQGFKWGVKHTEETTKATSNEPKTMRPKEEMVGKGRKGSGKQGPRLIQNRAKCITAADRKLIVDFKANSSIIKQDTVIGAMECIVTVSWGGPGQEGKDARDFCPDDLSKGMYYFVHADGRAQCAPFDNAIQAAVPGEVKNCCKPCETCELRPREDCRRDHCHYWLNETTKASLAQKALILPLRHPTAAAIFLKRTTPCEIFPDGREKCDHVFKAGICIDCKSIKNPCVWKPAPGYAGQTAWVDLHFVSGQGYTKQNWGHGTWPANGKPTGNGAAEYGCSQDQWFRSDYEKKPPPHRAMGEGYAKDPITVPLAGAQNGPKPNKPQISSTSILTLKTTPKMP
jgi:hypothetical protein